MDSGCYRDLCRGVLDIVARVRDTVCSHESAIYEDGSILTLARRSKKYGGYDKSIMNTENRYQKSVFFPLYTFSLSFKGGRAEYV